MATLRGFQSNTTISAAFWILKPDSTVDPVSKEQFVEINSIQYMEANAAVILSSITDVQVNNNVLTLTVASTSGIRSGMAVIFTGLTNATFLNGQVITVTSIAPTQIIANFTNANYGPASEPAGATLTDATSRMVWIYYSASNVSTSQTPRQLQGPVAAMFLYDMENLFGAF